MWVICIAENRIRGIYECCLDAIIPLESDLIYKNISDLRVVQF